MKKQILKSALIAVAGIGLLTGSANALQMNIYALGDSNIQAWINGLGGATTVIENFDNIATGYSSTLNTAIGDFVAGGDAGFNGTYSNGLVQVEINDRQYDPTTAPGRGNLFSNAGNYLDSNDITMVTLNIDQNLRLTNLFFYLMDPNDVLAKTVMTATGEENTISYTFLNKLPNGSAYFVGITLADGEAFKSLELSTGEVRNDGWGVDNFGTAAPIPEPASMLLFGAGLVGLAGTRRRMNK